jgi:hypothetical protein
MKSASNHNGQSSALNDHLAKMLTRLILKVQSKLASRFSKRFNSYSVRKQKSYLIIAGILVTAILISGLLTNDYSIPPITQNYTPATHIGMASNVNPPEKSGLQLTDSLTKKH